MRMSRLPSMSAPPPPYGDVVLQLIAPEQLSTIRPEAQRDRELGSRRQLAVAAEGRTV
jgi:hypothetical protein